MSPLNLLLFSGLLFSSPAFAGDGEATELERTFYRHINKTVASNYLAYLPKNYDPNSSNRWPLIFFLHGSGERGSDLAKVRSVGLPKWLESHKDLPFIVIAPQVRENADWDIDTLNALLDEALDQFRVDHNRVYLTGLSMGGHATWKWALHNPERFAAIAPICGIGHRYLACQLSNLPVWAFHGTSDSVVPFTLSESMIKAVHACGGDARLTAYEGGGHDAWTETYSNPLLYNWLLQHQRRH
jgi:predicted peptidase